MSAIESISYENCSCNTLPDLWHALHNSYNSAMNRPVDTCFLNKIPQVTSIEWPVFSKQEFRDAIAKCSLSSALGPDHISWRHLKTLFSSDLCLEKIVNVTNACINLEFWPSYFKATNTVIIPKPNKESYSIPSPIVLLNTTCHDLAKWLSHYLYFFSFLFLFFYLGLTTQKEVQESVMSQVSHSHSHMTGSHSITSHNVT